MTLAFSTHFPKGKGTLSERPTRFPEKIWYSIASEISDEEYYKWHGEEGILNYNMGNNFNDSIFNINPKLHTIRKDSKNRWKAGNIIHPVINNRTPQRFQFAPTLECIAIQNIEIVHHGNYAIDPYVFIDDNVLTDEQVEQLAINDGFDSTHDFFEWFNEDFKGKIIHWTNHKY